MASEKKVEYNFLGNSGLKVSNICLGAMTFGKTDENEMMALVCINVISILSNSAQLSHW